MDVGKLVRMANQIAANFDYGNEEGKKVAATCDHLSRFWNSAMKKQLIEYRRSGEEGLSTLAAAAVDQLAEKESDAA